jgi:hypothetical protein
VTLPKNAESISLNSALQDSLGKGIRFEVILEGEGLGTSSVFSKVLMPGQTRWEAFEIPMNSYAGKTIHLRFVSQTIESNGDGGSLLRSPFIEIALNNSPEENPEIEKPVQPSNTELSPDFPKPTPQDWVLSDQDQFLWEFKEQKWIHSGATESESWRVGMDPDIIFKKALEIPLKNYGHLYLQMTVSPGVPQKFARILMQVNGQPGYQKVVKLPLLSDGQPHSYTYEMRLLELSDNDRLTGIKLEAGSEDPPSEMSRIQISDLRLIHAPVGS